MRKEEPCLDFKPPYSLLETLTMTTVAFQNAPQKLYGKSRSTNNTPPIEVIPQQTLRDPNYKHVTVGEGRPGPPLTPRLDLLSGDQRWGETLI